MKRVFEFSASIITLMFFLIAPTWAGPRMGGSGGWGMGGTYSRMYDASTVETIKGKITAVEEITPMRGMSHGIHLMVKTDKESISVHLGPEWYIENQDVILKVGDIIEVTGSRISLDGKPAIIARMVQKGDQMLNLRDDQGYPAWSGWRRK